MSEIVAQAAISQGEAAPPSTMPAITVTVTAAGRAATLASFLEEIGTAVGDERYLRAAAFLRGKPAGRRALPDDRFVTEVLWLVETKAAASIPAAARMVAPTVLGNHLVESTVRRLARKARAKRVKRRL